MKYSTFKCYRFNYYDDGAHGWLRVEHSFILALSIENDVSDYSYMDTSYVYLEEDQDASTFIKAALNINDFSSLGYNEQLKLNYWREQVNHIQQNSRSFIRDLPRYDSSQLNPIKSPCKLNDTPLDSDITNQLSLF